MASRVSGINRGNDRNRGRVHRRRGHGGLRTFTGPVFAPFKGLALGVVTTFGYAAASLAPILIGSMADQHSVAEGLWRVCVPASFLTALSFALTFLIKPSLGRGAGPSGSRGNRTG